MFKKTYCTKKNWQPPPLCNEKSSERQGNESREAFGAFIEASDGDTEDDSPLEVIQCTSRFFECMDGSYVLLAWWIPWVIHKKQSPFPLSSFPAFMCDALVFAYFRRLSCELSPDHHIRSMKSFAEVEMVKYPYKYIIGLRFWRQKIDIFHNSRPSLRNDCSKKATKCVYFDAFDHIRRWN